MQFARSKNQKRGEFAASQIFNAIKKGEYCIGDKLPSEKKIAEMMGVSRPTIRDALGVLRLLGLIDTKNGYGTYVKSNELEATPFASSTVVQNLFALETNTFEMFEARKIIEPAIAEFAVTMLNEKSLEPITSAFNQMENAIKSPNFDEYHTANKKFHNAIALATNNGMMIKIMSSLLTLFTESELGVELRRRYLTDEKYRWKSLEKHKAILEDITHRNVNKIKNSFNDHFEQVEHQLLGI